VGKQDPYSLPRSQRRSPWFERNKPENGGAPEHLSLFWPKNAVELLAQVLLALEYCYPTQMTGCDLVPQFLTPHDCLHIWTRFNALTLNDNKTSGFGVYQTYSRPPQPDPKRPGLPQRRSKPNAAKDFRFKKGDRTHPKSLWWCWTF
jgi:hypothetical protein